MNFYARIVSALSPCLLERTIRRESRLFTMSLFSISEGLEQWWVVIYMIIFYLILLFGYKLLW